MTINDSKGENARIYGSNKNSPKALSPSKYSQDPIAVVGLACRLPGNSNSPHELWKFLEQGGVARNEAPESRFNLKTHYDGSKKPKTMRSPGGMFLENINPEEFDAGFFSIPSVDATAMDPQQRQLLEVVYECLENAGISLDEVDGAKIGCFVGSYAVDYADMQNRDPDDRVPSVTVGVGRAILSNRLSHFLNLKGPSMTIDTACSGSLVGLDVACRYLQTREADGAIVAGANLYLSPEHNMDSGAMKGASSLSGKCHTFDIKADGYIKAEAVNAVMLKRLDDAIRDGDPIRGVIRGSATNSDGRTPGIASPSAEAQSSAIRAAYANAGITDFDATSYLEFHGTGTAAGDPTEVKGAAAVFGARDQPLIIGSIKSNIGHSEPAAGISGLLKTILAIENGTIPGNPTFITPNPKIDFEGMKVRATRTAIPWPKVPFRRASINSFGYGGSNVHVVLEEAGKWTKSNHVSSYRKLEDAADFFDDDDESTSTRPSVLVFSANDDTSIRAYIKKLHSHLVNPNVKVNLLDLTYTLSERRTHHFNRAFAITNSTKFDQGNVVFGKKNSEPPRIGFVFTGQGAQWSQMGKQLVNNFPQARVLLQYLDTVLQHTVSPPPWSLLGMLTDPQSPSLLRQPEFSQPLVTALQLVIIDILRSWSVTPQAVAGHSSGEIAAAYAAGHLSKEDAIKAAFYRGQAAIQTIDSTQAEVGMLAAGLGPEEATKYFYGLGELVQIACYNSPKSITISGSLPALEKVKSRLLADNHFARLLQVDLAYHSTFMESIGNTYKSLLDRDFGSNYVSGSVKMFSSVLGRQLDHSPDAAYWKSNMVSPVLFDQAIKEMTSGREGANFLIEIGPSGALAGPISQIKKEVANGSDIQYCTALSRGQEAIKSLFDVAGRLFVAGGDINLSAVNGNSLSAQPAVIIDLPNYAWNHSNKYWYESEASKDWRYRLFPHHDLLGTKILSTSYHAPVWKKALVVDDLPWLKDHKMGPDIVFPAAAFMAMGIEAMSQVSQAFNILEGKPVPKIPRYRVRNSTFPKALVLEPGKKKNIMLSLAPRPGFKDSWHEFKVFSLTDDVWVENCKGLVRIEEDNQQVAPEGSMAPLTHSASGKLWYKAMEDAGYGFGPLFQKHLETESVCGSRSNRSIVDLSEPASINPQSFYPMHPASIDGCLQTCAPGLWNGNRSSVNAVLIPSIIDDVLVCPGEGPATGMSLSSSRYVGVGRPEEARNYMSDATIYDQETGRMLFQVLGLRFHKLETNENSYAAHKFGRLTWKPDVTFITQDGLSDHAKVVDTDDDPLKAVHEVIDLVAHKIPNLKVSEINMVPNDSTSIFIDGVSSGRDVRAAYRTYNFSSADATTLISAQEKYEAEANTEFGVLDVTQELSEGQLAGTDFDLIIARFDQSSCKLINIVKNCRAMMRKGGHLLLIEHSQPNEDLSLPFKTATDAEHFELFSSQGFVESHIISTGKESQLLKVYLTTIGGEETNVVPPRSIALAHLSPATELKTKIKAGLEASGWDIIDYELPIDSIPSNGPILILDDLSSPILPGMREDQWKTLKDITTMGKQILWVTEGSQLDVTIPENAMIHGLARTIRSEDPSISITTLDVEHGHGENTITSINKILKFLEKPSPKTQIDHEFVERQGVLHISRVLPDNPVNKAVKEETHGGELVKRSIHDADTTIRLICERLGTLDSLCFAEIGSEELPLGDNKVEVEIATAGLNFKDVAITMGIVPENQHLLGLEGAGTIRRAGTTSYKVGQRVLVFEKGTFANRIIATTERVYPIPDSMSFEEAATLASVYLVSIYSLWDLSNTQKGQRVLIHSATGGLGIACIQLCHYIGAEVYATVGTDEKRKFLMDNFGIPASNIFHSRTTAFAAELMRATNNQGVDVIINSLTGELLEESWRCIREGGTMVELGKKDMLDRNSLSMEPFGRNASYRCFDMAHKHVSDKLIARLLKQLMDLVDSGHVKPISPIKIFKFEEIAEAFRYMRGSNHIGKIVISNGAETNIRVPVRPTPRTFKLRGDVSYLIVGGLKGLCGSLAIELAKQGAKHLVILARSGCGDKMSQAAIHNIIAQGCQVDLMKGDVSVLEDIRRVFKEASLPIGGIIQGAMVLRDKFYSDMTHQDYHDVITCKIAGTWNLHKVALEEKLKLDFFTMLSSVSGVVGQKGQANYAAANVFLDAFSVYRQSLGLQANSIDLGAVEEVGYISRNSELLQIFDPTTWMPINEALFHKIVKYSIIQQIAPINVASTSQLISGIAIPLGEKSGLLADARFAGLAFGTQSSGAADGKDGSKEMQALSLLLKSKAEPHKILAATVDVMNQQFVVALRLSEPMEPAKPLSSYGLDSLAAVEMRNWMRMELGADISVLDITSAKSLYSLCEKVITKIQVPA